MKKGILRIFAFCTVLNFFFIGAVAWFTTYRETSPLQLLFLVALGALVVSFGITFSYSSSKDQNSADGLTSETTEGAANFAAALKVLVSPPFALFWLVAVLLVGGQWSLSAGNILGSAAVVVGQIFWAGARAPLRAFTDSLRVPPAVADWLRLILAAMDGAILLSVILLVANVGDYARVVDKLLAAGLAACLAAALALARWRRFRKGGAIIALVQFMVLWAWASPAVLALNFALDAREPAGRHVVSFRECPSRSNDLFNNANERIPENADTALFEGCKFFVTPPPPAMDDQMETLHFKGAFGIAWAKSRPLVKQTP